MRRPGPQWRPLPAAADPALVRCAAAALNLAAAPPSPASCPAPTRRQRNFLPFRCRCGKFYCDEHRRTCSCLAAEAQVQLCRTCALSIIVRPGEDVEEVLSR